MCYSATDRPALLPGAAQPAQSAEFTHAAQNRSGAAL